MQKLGLWPWILCLVLMIMLGWNLPPPNLDNVSTCPLKEKTKNTPADTIVFFGSSSLGVAIDPFYIAKKLNQDGGTTVDYVVDVGWRSTKILNNIYEYIENRGLPKVLVINIPAIPNEDVPNYIYDEKTLKSSDLITLLKVQSFFSDVFGRNQILNHMLLGWKSNVELINYKTTQAIMSFWEINVARVFKVAGEGNCINNSLKPKFFPRNKIDDDINFKEEGWLLWMGMKKNKEKNLKKEYVAYFDNVEKHFPIDLTNSFNVHTFKVMRKIAALFHDKVDRIYFTFGPQFAVPVPISENYVNQLTTDYNNIKYINSANAFKNPSTDLSNKEYFLNLKHLNYEGARIVSQYWVKILSEDKTWRH